MSWTGLFGVKMCQGFQQPQSNITFHNVVVYGCSCAIGIDHLYGNGFGSNILFENFDIELITWTVSEKRTWLALSVDCDNQRGVVGTFGDVTMRNLTIRDMRTTGSEIRGCNSSVVVGKVSLEEIRPPGLGRTARTLRRWVLRRLSKHQTS